MTKNTVDPKLFLYPMLSVAAFVSLFHFPLFAGFLTVASFIFIFLYFGRKDRNRISDILLVAFIIVGIMYSSISGALYLPIVLIPVAILHLVRSRLSVKRPEYLYLSVVLAPLAFALMTAYAINFVPEFRKEIYDWFFKFFTDFTAPVKNTLERFDNQGFITYIMNNKEEAINRIIAIVPALEYVAVAFIIFMLDRMRPEFDAKGALIVRKFRLPDNFVWVFIAIGFLSLVDNDSVKTISYNFIIIFGTLYLFQGFELFNVMFDKLKLSIFLKMLIYLFLYTEIFILIFISIVGLFNIWIKPKIFTESSESQDG